jgi:hypothetical protein
VVELAVARDRWTNSEKSLLFNEATQEATKQIPNLGMEPGRTCCVALVAVAADTSHPVTPRAALTSHNKSTWLPTWSCNWALPGKQPFNAAKEGCYSSTLNSMHPLFLQTATHVTTSY